MNSKQILDHMREVKTSTVTELATQGIAGVKTVFALMKLIVTRRVRVGPGDKLTYLG